MDVKNLSFINKSRSKFGDRYSYSNTVYSSSFEELTLTCTTHGDFTIKALNHLNSKLGGCAECAKEKYKNSNPTGSKQKTTEEFIAECKATHTDIDYDYSEVVYVNLRTKVDIICPTHGRFSMTPKDFLKGRNCPKCNIRKGPSVKNDKGHGWSRSDYINRCTDGIASLYIIKISSSDESFFKIGITTNTLENRFSSGRLPPGYLYKEVLSVSGDAGYIYDLENELTSKTLESRYVPQIKFNGHTECRTKDIFNLEEIQRLL
jgi:hypothetical protein